MFINVAAFNQNISEWNVGNLTELTNLLKNSNALTSNIKTNLEYNDNDCDEINYIGGNYTFCDKATL